MRDCDASPPGGEVERERAGCAAWTHWVECESRWLPPVTMWAYHDSPRDRVAESGYYSGEFRHSRRARPSSRRVAPSRQSRPTENPSRRNRVASKLSDHMKRGQARRDTGLGVACAASSAHGAGGAKLGQAGLPTKSTLNRRANPCENGPRSGSLGRLLAACINPHRGALVSGPVRSMVRAPQPRIVLEAALFQPPPARPSELREALPP
jgi:hypothetical protein